MGDKTAGIESAGEWFAAHPGLAAELSDRIFDLAEPGLVEYESSQLLADTLAASGFDVTMGVAGLPTSFTARWGSGLPIVGFMAENDATPGESQAPVPRPEPVSPNASGFVDLHNGIGSASIAAALATQHAMKAQGMKGTIVVLGTAAEKLCIGKPFMARDGYFDELSAMIAWHPRPYSTVEWDSGPGCYQVEVFTFDGVSSYGARPWDGKSALDGVTLMNVIVQFLREHVRPQFQATINEFVTRGGMHPTSLPSTAEVWYVHRANSIEGADYLSALLERAASSAASALGINVKRNIISATRPWLPNHEMAMIAYRNLELAGAPDFPRDMVQFGNEVLTALGRETREDPYDRIVTPVESGITAEFGGGADDVNEFCWHTPTARIYLAYGLSAYGLPTWAQGAFARTSVGHATVDAAARAMAFTAVDILTDPEQLVAARAELDRRLAETGPVPPRLPADSVAPVTPETAPPFVRDYLLDALQRREAK